MRGRRSCREQHLLLRLQQLHGLSESPLPDLCGLRGCNAVGLGSGAGPATAVKPRIRREEFPGLASYFPIDGTASNGGPVQSSDWAISELWRRGFKTFIDIAPGRDAQTVAAAARGVGMKYMAIPMRAPLPAISSTPRKSNQRSTRSAIGQISRFSSIQPMVVRLRCSG
jgi:hypothetical protein